MLTATRARQDHRVARTFRAAALGALVLLAGAPRGSAQQPEAPSDAPDAEPREPQEIDAAPPDPGRAPSEALPTPVEERPVEERPAPEPRDALEGTEAEGFAVDEDGSDGFVHQEVPRDRAEPAPLPLIGPSPGATLGPRAAVWLDGGFTVGGPDEEHVLAFSPELGLRYRVVEELVAEVSFGLTLASTEVRGTGTLGGEPVDYDAGVRRADPGNPVVRALYSGRVARNIVLETGLAVAIPTAARDEYGADARGLAQRVGSEVSYRAALAMRGYWSPWRWAPERFSVAVPLRLAIEIEWIVIDAELGLGLMFPVLGDRGVDPDVVVQLAAGVGARVVGPLSLGVHLRGVGAALGATVPGVVVSTEPWVGLDVAPVRVTLRATINLNGDDGVAGARGPAFGLFLGAAVGF